MSLLNKSYDVKLLSEIKSVHDTDEGDLIIEGYANTVSKDRVGDVIPIEAWEHPEALKDYIKNPIILAFHDHSKPIGKMIEHEITEFGLRIKARISKGAGDVYTLIKDGILSTFSVGFRLLDAEYDNKTDTYFINEVSLHEVSVVSVPCNQDSVFSVAKSMDSKSFEEFKNKLTPDSGEEKEENTMTREEVLAMLKESQPDQAQVTQDAVAKAMAEMEAKKKAEEAAKEKAEAEKAATEKLITEKASEAAKSLVKQLEDELSQDRKLFAETIKEKADEIVALKEEIAQVVSARNTKFNPITAAISSQAADAQLEKDANDLVMLATIKEVGVFETNYGKAFHAEKAVNPSSSIVVSSDGYETTFSTNLIRDIQAELVIAPLFTEMQMTTANMTIPINPGRSNANWVAAAAMDDGSDAARTGAEITATLTERTLTTFKLAAKTYLTEETQEDTVLSLIPLLRQHLVEAHAQEIDNAFLNGTGTGEPKGLITQATAIGANATVTGAAKADGSVKVTAAEILTVRRKLGLYGVKLRDLALLISQDAYWDLLEDPEWADVQQVGMADSTKLVGEVGNIYGMPVLVSNEFPAKAVSTAYAVLVNKTNFVVPRQRGMTVRSDFDVERDRRVFVATQRLNLEPLFEVSAGNGKGVAMVTYAAV